MNGTVALRAVGCRTNQQEMTALRFQLMESGYRVDERPDRADIVVLNTCCVTGAAEAKSRRALCCIRRQAPRARIVVTGCLAELDPARLASIGSGQMVVGNGGKAEIARLVAERAEGVVRPALGPASRPLRCDRSVVDPARSSLTRFPVKVQEGCDRACAYCIVPSVRGPSRSAPVPEVILACRRAVEAGFKELVITGTHIGQYRAGAVDLSDLVGRLCDMDGDFRIRLSSLDPRDCHPSLMAMVAVGPRLCRHLHLSVQSLSADVLRAMGRPDEGLETMLCSLDALRRACPGLALGGDFIVGFPGETEAMFEQTCQRVERAGFTFGHVFRFCARPGTRAAAMAGQIAEEEKKRRAERMIGVLAALTERFMRSILGSTQRIVVEREAPLRGVTSNYVDIEVPAGRAARNTWVDVVPTDVVEARRRRMLGRVAPARCRSRAR